MQALKSSDANLMRAIDSTGISGSS